MSPDPLNPPSGFLVPALHIPYAPGNNETSVATIATAPVIDGLGVVALIPPGDRVGLDRYTAD